MKSEQHNWLGLVLLASFPASTTQYNNQWAHSDHANDVRPKPASTHLPSLLCVRKAHNEPLT